MMIELRKLRKVFDTFVAVDGVSLSVEAGEVLGFLGPNGAGKSTTMRMATGFLTPTSGAAIVCGHDIARAPIEAKRQFGYLPEGAPMYPDMTPEGLLRFVAEVRGFKGRERRQRVRAAADRVHLAGVMRQPIETLSKGYKRRVGLAQALLHEPRVLILDEPTDGLDPNQKHEVRELIRGLGSERAVILSTHILEEVEALCSRAVIIARGRVVADGTPDQLRRRARRHNAVRLGLRAAPDGLVEDLRRVPGVADIERVGSGGGEGGGVGGGDPSIRLRVVSTDGRSIVTGVSDLLRSRAIEVDEMLVEPGRLDEVFRDLTGGARGARAGAAPNASNGEAA